MGFVNFSRKDNVIVDINSYCKLVHCGAKDSWKPQPNDDNNVRFLRKWYFILIKSELFFIEIYIIV